jgi:hypothetical protein
MVEELSKLPEDCSALGDRAKKAVMCVANELCSGELLSCRLGCLGHLGSNPVPYI